jgi:hypothetical protein
MSLEQAIEIDKLTKELCKLKTAYVVLNSNSICDLGIKIYSPTTDVWINANEAIITVVKETVIKEINRLQNELSKL